LGPRPAHRHHRSDDPIAWLDSSNARCSEQQSRAREGHPHLTTAYSLYPIPERIRRDCDLHRAVVTVDGDDGHGTTPHARDVLEHSAAALGVQAAAVRDMVVHELEPAVHVHARDGDRWGAEAVFRCE